MRHRHSVTEDPVKVVGIAAIAAAVGVAVAMLFTPRSGDQVRRGLKRRASNLKEDVQDRFDRTAHEAEEAAQEAKDRLQAAATKVAKDKKTGVTKVKRSTSTAKTRANSDITAAKKPAKRRTASQ